MNLRLGHLALLLPLFVVPVGYADEVPAEPAADASTEAPADDTATDASAEAPADGTESTDAAATDTTTAEPAAADAASTDAGTDAAATDAATTDAATTDAAATDATATDATATDAAATDTTATDATATDAGAADLSAEAAPADAAAEAPVEEAPVEEAAATDEYASEDGADEGGFDAESSVKGHPLYVSPMFTYTLADEDRGTDDGMGGTISVGKKVTDAMMLELTGFFSTFGADTGAGGVDTGDMEFKGAGLNALVFPLNSFPDAYAVIGLAVGASSSHPGPIPNYKTTVFDTGIGYLFPISPKFLIRAEARYRMDAHGRELAGVGPGENKAFYDGAFNIGFLMPLGTTAAPPAETAEVVDPNAGDADNDGVPDAQDQCPGTPAGAQVNEQGCEADADGDGVPDRLDQCPDTPAGQQVNDVGCPMDKDGDGVADDKDECPNTPAGAKVLANGCALVGDCRTPRPGEQVDENGCAVEKKFILRGVKFEFDSDRLTPEAQEILNEVAGTLQAYPDISVELQGHTDNIGTDAYNQGLSERRANAVKTYLAGRGIEAGRMTPAGYGEAQPIESNETEEGREENRRVELKVLE